MPGGWRPPGGTKAEGRPGRAAKTEATAARDAGKRYCLIAQSRKTAPWIWRAGVWAARRLSDELAHERGEGTAPCSTTAGDRPCGARYDGRRLPHGDAGQGSGGAERRQRSPGGTKAEGRPGRAAKTEATAARGNQSGRSRPSNMRTAGCKAGLRRYCRINCRSSSFKSSLASRTSSSSSADTCNASQMAARISASGRFRPCSQLDTRPQLTPICVASAFWLNPRCCRKRRMRFPISYRKVATSFSIGLQLQYDA